MFNGFSPKTTQFLKDLGENNCKEWFEEHRNTYENELLTPLKELVAALSPAMYNIDPEFELRPHRVLSRIYRDIRFSKNKDPYKTFMWMAFQRPTKNWENIAGYFFEISPESYSYGMGLFAPKKKNMDAFRENIAYDAKEFRQQTQLILDRGFSIGGEEYKRPIASDLPEYFQPWIQRKGVYVIKKKTTGEELFSSAFADLLRDEFESLEWLYNFMKDEQ